MQSNFGFTDKPWLIMGRYHYDITEWTGSHVTISVMYYFDEHLKGGAKILKKNTSLTYLNVRIPLSDDAGAFLLPGALQSSRTLTVLTLSGYLFGNLGAISKTLTKNRLYNFRRTRYTTKVSNISVICYM